MDASVLLGTMLLVIVAAPIAGFVWAVMRAWRTRSISTWAWIAAALAGLPAIGFGILLYLFVVPVALAVFLPSMVLSRWRSLDYVMPLLCILASTALGIAFAFGDEGSRARVLGSLFAVSMLAALLSVAKLGRVAGAELLYEKPDATQADVGPPAP